MPDSRPSPRSYVYFIQSGEAGPVKIGSSVDPFKRREQLQNASHEPLTVCLLVEGGEATEREFHTRFADRRVRGEWFDRSVLMEDLPEVPTPFGIDFLLNEIHKNAEHRRLRTQLERHGMEYVT
jgi:hypothetical protein